MKITHWRNKNASGQRDFLLIGESFGNIPFSLMSLVIRSCDEVDVRHFDWDFADYFYSYKPDTIIVAVNIHGLLDEFTQYSYLG